MATTTDEAMARAGTTLPGLRLPGIVLGVVVLGVGLGGFVDAARCPQPGAPARCRVPRAVLRSALR
ncbi:hypothetical protein [Streptomyces sp. bgisy153]|uniref:hypothetical protein n=1 Tax=Streptomyces sp. bgisy153 TaxID=3413793 RepID=UPI003D712A46